MNLDEKRLPIIGSLFITTTPPFSWERYKDWSGIEVDHIPVRLPKIPPPPPPKPAIKIYPPEDPMEDIGYGRRRRSRDDD